MGRWKGIDASAAMPPIFFQTPDDLRRWFAENHATARELHVGYHKKAVGEPSITWPESVDEALCVGWIDGVRRRLDERSYMIRFTPRKATSIWSAVNIARVAALTAWNRMLPAGLAAFAARRESRSAVYSYEQTHHAGLDPAHEALFKNHPAAWEFFQRQPPGYRKLAIHRVTSAKQEATRLRRLEKLIAESAQGRRLL